MAGNAVIGALRVVLGADTAAFEDGLKSAQAKLSSFGANVAKAGAVLGAAMAAAGTAVGVAVKHAIDQAEELNKASQKIGVPVEELSKLKYAADLADVSFESFSKSVVKLSKTMAEAAKDDTGEAASAFAALGISVTNADGTLKATSDTLSAIAGKFAGFEDSASKTALAVALFGKAGADMIPFLNQGAKGIDDLKREAEQLGVVIDEKTRKSAEEFNDNLKRLGKVKDGIITKIAAGLVPALQNLSERMVEAAKSSEVMSNITKTLDVTLRALVSTGVVVGAVFTHAADVIGKAGLALGQIASGSFTAAWETIKSGVTGASERATAAIETLRRIWDDSNNQMAAKAAETAPKIDAPIVQSLKKIEDEERKQIALGLEMAEEWVSWVEKTRTPSEELIAEQAKISEAFQRGVIDADLYGRAMEMAAEKAGASWNKAAPSIAGSFQEIAQAFGKENAGMAKAAQILGAVQALIATYVGSAEALKLPFPANLAASLAVAAKGFALVAAIKSASVPGFAQGGSFRVGGSGGVDSQLVQFKASPGEMVDIHRPGNVGGGGRGRAGSILTVEGLDPRRFFSGESVRELAQSLIDYQRDGGTIVLAPA